MELPEEKHEQKHEEKQKAKVLKAFHHEGKEHKPGDHVELEHKKFEELKQSGHVEEHR